MPLFPPVCEKVLSKCQADKSPRGFDALEEAFGISKKGEVLGLEGLTVTPTKESDPNGVDQHAAGAKLDAGKPDLSLLLMFGRALTEVGRVGTFGAEKYTRGGWRSVSSGIIRYTAALLRHLFKEDRQEYDDELPVLHAAQVAWNSLARLELMLAAKEEKKGE